MSYSNKNLVMGPRWVSDTETDWKTDRQLQDIFNLNFSFNRSGEGATGGGSHKFETVKIWL
jgi:hypothetical protein